MYSTSLVFFCLSLLAQSSPFALSARQADKASKGGGGGGGPLVNSTEVARVLTASVLNPVGPFKKGDVVNWPIAYALLSNDGGKTHQLGGRFRGKKDPKLDFNFGQDANFTNAGSGQIGVHVSAWFTKNFTGNVRFEIDLNWYEAFAATGASDPDNITYSTFLFDQNNKHTNVGPDLIYVQYSTAADKGKY